MKGQHYSRDGIALPTLPTRLAYEVASVVEAFGKEAMVPVSGIAEYSPNLTTAQPAFFWIP